MNGPFSLAHSLHAQSDLKNHGRDRERFSCSRLKNSFYRNGREVGALEDVRHLVVYSIRKEKAKFIQCIQFPFLCEMASNLVQTCMHSVVEQARCLAKKVSINFKRTHA